MFLIQSIVMAQPGKRDELVGIYKELIKDVPEIAGGNPCVLTGSIGPSDSTVILQSEHASLAEFEKGLESANRNEKMAKYGPKFGQLTVPGSHRFEVFRINK